MIPWIKTIDPQGKEEIYADEASGYSAVMPPKGEMRRMDCMDCHNRPSHIFQSPVEAVNEALAYGAIDPSLPYIRREAVKVLLNHSLSHKEAAAEIRGQLERFYQDKYPRLSAEKSEALGQAVKAVTEIYQANFFPQMNVSWKVYPDNIGHMIFPGCFRCHDGQHKTSEGKVLRNDCNICHVITAQGTPEAMETRLEGLEFRHPEDIGDAWKEMKCYDGHTGGSD